jgi:hypothetical protein
VERACVHSSHHTIGVVRPLPSLSAAVGFIAVDRALIVTYLPTMLILRVLVVYGLIVYSIKGHIRQKELKRYILK